MAVEPLVILVTETVIAGTQFTIRFSSVAGLTGFKVMGSTNLLTFPADKTAVSAISETSPGNYQAVVNISGLPPSFLSIACSSCPQWCRRASPSTAGSAPSGGAWIAHDSPSSAVRSRPVVATCVNPPAVRPFSRSGCFAQHGLPCHSPSSPLKLGWISRSMSRTPPRPRRPQSRTVVPVCDSSLSALELWTACQRVSRNLPQPGPAMGTMPSAGYLHTIRYNQLTNATPRTHHGKSQPKRV